MKKFLYAFAFVLCATNAMAETYFVIDDNGYVTGQMTTTTTTYTAPALVTSQPQVTVVRSSPVVQNSYYYDSYSTGSAFAAGVTTAVIGALLFDGFHVRHHHKHKAPVVIHHGSHHGFGHHGKPAGHKHKR
ncbi:MAG: hypothetical protein IJS26_02280 [Alphaproteobacteria bacterium]|nr:hypothetical protein [Alphaproteobacteria bacterium]